MADAQSKNLLIFQSAPNDEEDLLSFLCKEEFSITKFSNLQKLVRSAILKKPDLLIFKTELDKNSLQKIIKIHKSFFNLATILIIDKKYEKIAFNVLSKGIDEFLIQGEYSQQELLRTLRNTIERKKQINNLLRKKSINPWDLKTQSKKIATKVQSFDLTKFQLFLKKNAKSLMDLDNFDNLTALPNKIYLKTQIADYLSSKKNKFALLLLDLDKFNSVNDLYGQNIGDLLIIAVSQWIGKNLGPNDFFARFGSDEFAIITALPNMSDYGYFANKINEISKCSFDISGVNIRVSLSIGIAIYALGETAEDLIKNAEIALCNAKKHGRNSYQYFQKDVDEPKKKLLSIESQLHFAVENNEFCLLFQPIVELKTKKVIGFEALLRWHSPNLGDIDPGIFIKIAEASAIISEITEWVIKQVLLNIANWQKKIQPQFVISVNLSSLDITQLDFNKKILNNLKKYNVAASNLFFELTETAIMYDEKIADKNLHSLSRAGIKILIDDFGTGYSSLNRVKSLPVDIIKIDKSFVRDILLYEVDCQVVKSIISLANSLNLSTIAEGIESEEVALYLEKLGCKYGQGFYFAKPMGINEAIIFYQKNQNNRIC